jgi:GNAT superfamily N-acetyltransferase
VSVPKHHWSLRTADRDLVDAIGRFGADHIRAHYSPLIGPAAADAQVRTWWNESVLSTAAGQGLLIVALEDDEVVGVGQRGTWDAVPVIWKLYVHPDRRGHGLGPRLIEALIDQLPADADRVLIEHFAANVRAGAFYEREGFAIERVEPSPDGDRALDTVWRTRTLNR